MFILAVVPLYPVAVMLPVEEINVVALIKMVPAEPGPGSESDAVPPLLSTMIE